MCKGGKGKRMIEGKGDEKDGKLKGKGRVRGRNLKVRED